jgi:hypothetical protein
MSAYDAIIKAFPANVTVVLDPDAGSIEFRIVSSNLMSLRDEMKRIEETCAGRAWVGTVGPVRWDAGLDEPQWVIHGMARMLAT